MGVDGGLGSVLVNYPGYFTSSSRFNDLLILRVNVFSLVNSINSVLNLE